MALATRHSNSPLLPCTPPCSLRTPITAPASRARRRTASPLCARAPAPSARGCLLRYYPRRCGGISPATMIRQYRKHQRHLSAVLQHDWLFAISEHVAAEYAASRRAADTDTRPATTRAAARRWDGCGDRTEPRRVRWPAGGIEGTPRRNWCCDRRRRRALAPLAPHDCRHRRCKRRRAPRRCAHRARRTRAGARWSAA